MANLELRILIAEDHSIVREGLKSLLTYNGLDVVAMASNGEEAVEQYKLNKPDVVLMDLRMPKMSGAQAIITIRASFPEAKIIALTTFSGDEDIHAALRAGAQGYLLKDASTDDLLTAIRAVAAGSMAVSPGVANRLIERASNPSLTPREIDILAWLAKGKSNKEIGQSLFITEGTVKTHVNKLLEKLNVKDRTEAVVVGVKRGLIQLD